MAEILNVTFNHSNMAAIQGKHSS